MIYCIDLSKNLIDNSLIKEKIRDEQTLLLSSYINEREYSFNILDVLKKADESSISGSDSNMQS